MAASNEKILEKTGILPPQNIEAELSVLGSILLDKDAITKVADILNPRDFYKEAHAIIYKAMFELYEKNEPIDIVTVSNKLESEKMMEKIGGASQLAALANAVPSAAHVVNYAKIVSDKATLSKLISAANEIEKICYDGKADVAEILDKAEQTVFRVSEKHIREN